MPRITIEGIPRYDGTYELAVPFTTRDWRVIKKVSGVRPLELMDAIRTADVELSVALAINALRQAGKGEVPPDLFDQAESGSILVDWGDGEEEEEDRPPASTTTGGTASSPVAQNDDVEKKPSSGMSSSSDGDQSETNLRAIGGLS